jgi:hypothetical protein
MGVALLLFNLSRPPRLIELSNLTQTASRTLAENTQYSETRSNLGRAHSGAFVSAPVLRPHSVKPVPSRGCEPSTSRSPLELSTRAPHWHEAEDVSAPAEPFQVA